MGIQGASKAMQWSKCLLLLVPSVLIALCVIYFAGDDADVTQSVQKASAAEVDPRTQFRRHYLEEEEVPSKNYVLLPKNLFFSTLYKTMSFKQRTYKRDWPVLKTIKGI